MSSRVWLAWVAMALAFGGCGSNENNKNPATSSPTNKHELTLKQIASRPTSFSSRALSAHRLDGRLKVVELARGRTAPLTEADARKLIDEHAPKLGLSSLPSGSELQMRHELTVGKDKNRTQLMIFNSQLRGRRVLGSELRVHQARGRVWAENHLVLSPMVRAGGWDDLDRSKLQQLARKQARVKRLRSWEKKPVRIEQAWMPRYGALVPVNRVALLSADPAGDYVVLIQGKKAVSVRKLSRGYTTYTRVVGNLFKSQPIPGDLEGDAWDTQFINSVPPCCSQTKRMGYSTAYTPPPVVCAEPSIDCSGICVDVQSDPNHCGACNSACAPGTSCVAGVCTGCPAGMSECGGACVDFNTDPNNCGDCNNVCAQPGAVMGCVSGVCVVLEFCQPPMDSCNNTCVDLQTDPNNCGTCGSVCVQGAHTLAPECAAGVCVPGSCLPGYFDCDANPQNGCEVSTLDDPNNCGQCGNACTPNEMCISGSCQDLQLVSLTANCAQTTVAAGSNVQCTVYGMYNTGAVIDLTNDPNLVWTSSNVAVATINATTGELTAISPGTSNVMATTSGLVSNPVPITVVPASQGTEVCDGMDNNADGQVDEGIPPQSCYSGPTGSAGVGACQAGTSSCINGSWGPCEGEVLPAAEVCNGIDDDCNGVVDDNTPQPCACTAGDTQPCGTDVGECVSGTLTCIQGLWGSCTGAIQPSTEICDGLDNDCDGIADEGCANPPPLTTTTPEPAGPNCPDGGVRVDTGTDTNANGVLDPEEVTSTQYVCNAPQQYLAGVRILDDVGPATCELVQAEACGTTCEYDCSTDLAGEDASTAHLMLGRNMALSAYHNLVEVGLWEPDQTTTLSGLSALEFPIRAFADLDGAFYSSEAGSISLGKVLLPYLANTVPFPVGNSGQSAQASQFYYSIDGEVPGHELGHAVVNRLSPSWAGIEASSVHEALADFMSAVASNDSCMGETISCMTGNLKQADGTVYNCATADDREACLAACLTKAGVADVAACVRNLNVTPDDKKPYWEQLAYDANGLLFIHESSQVFSSALWAMRDKLIGDSAVLRSAIHSVPVDVAGSGLPLNPTYATLAKQLQNEAKQALSAEDAAVVAKTLAAYGFFDSEVGPSDSHVAAAQENNERQAWIAWRILLNLNIGGWLDSPEGFLWKGFVSSPQGSAWKQQQLTTADTTTNRSQPWAEDPSVIYPHQHWTDWMQSEAGHGWIDENLSEIWKGFSAQLLVSAMESPPMRDFIAQTWHEFVESKCTAAPAPTCVEGERRCVGDAYEQCINGSFVLAEVCATGTICVDGDCVVPQCTIDAECSDGMWCTGTESCVNGACQAGTPPNCDDGNTCTIDSCNEASDMCNHVTTPVDEPCPFGTCDGFGTCVAISCASDGECNDGNACTTDSCDLASGTCVGTPIPGCCTQAADCVDGDPCTIDSCSNNTCTFTPAAGCCTAASQCDDNDPCTTDSCVSNTCENAVIPGCGPGTPESCDPANPPTLDQAEWRAYFQQRWAAMLESDESYGQFVDKEQFTQILDDAWKVFINANANRTELNWQWALGASAGWKTFGSVEVWALLFRGMWGSYVKNPDYGYSQLIGSTEWHTLLDDVFDSLNSAGSWQAYTSLENWLSTFINPWWGGYLIWTGGWWDTAAAQLYSTSLNPWSFWGSWWAVWHGGWEYETDASTGDNTNTFIKWGDWWGGYLIWTGGWWQYVIDNPTGTAPTIGEPWKLWGDWWGGYLIWTGGWWDLELDIGAVTTPPSAVPAAVEGLSRSLEVPMEEWLVWGTTNPSPLPSPTATEEETFTKENPQVWLNEPSELLQEGPPTLTINKPLPIKAKVGKKVEFTITATNPPGAITQPTINAYNLPATSTLDNKNKTKAKFEYVAPDAMAGATKTLMFSASNASGTTELEVTIIYQ